MTVRWRVAEIVWLLACVLILILTLVYRGPEYRDAAAAEILIMLGLSFPSGWLFPVLLRLLEMLKLFDLSQTTELQGIFIAWAPLFVMGYLQWFVAVPAIVRWWRRRFRHNGSGTLSIVPRD